MTTFDGFVRIGKITWTAIWAVVLLVRFSSDSTATAAGPSSYEAMSALQMLLCVLGLPLAPLLSYPAMALTGSSELGIAVAVVAVHIQWFHLVPHLWRVFQKGRELRL